MTTILTVSVQAGARSLVANYGGDVGNAPSTSATVPLTVSQAATTVAVTASPRTAAGAT
jgi:hypothetical protein